MNALIQITELDGQQAVNARELHSFLEGKRQFGNWIQYRIKSYGLVEGVDYLVFNNSVKNSSGGRSRKEYALTISCAKELAMVEGNKKGKAARLYFIECERRLKANDLQQRVAVLEAQVLDLRKQLLKPSSKPKQLKPGIELDLVRKHFGPPANDNNTRFLSASEIVAHITYAEKVPVGVKRIAQAVTSITGIRSCVIPVGDHRAKRGYWLQLLTV